MPYYAKKSASQAFLSDTYQLETLPGIMMNFYPSVDVCVKFNSSGFANPRLVPVQLPGGMKITKLTLVCGDTASVGLTHSWVTIYGIAPGVPTAMTTRAYSQDVTGEWTAGSSRDFFMAANFGGVQKPWVTEMEATFLIMIGINVTGSMPKLRGVTYASTFGAPAPNSGVWQQNFSSQTTNSVFFNTITNDLTMPYIGIT